MCFLWMESLWCFNNIKMMFFWRKHHERVPRASFWKDLTPSIPIPPALPQGLGQMFQLRSWCVVFPAWIGRFDLLGVVLIIRLTLPIYIYIHYVYVNGFYHYFGKPILQVWKSMPWGHLLVDLISLWIFFDSSVLEEPWITFLKWTKILNSYMIGWTQEWFLSHQHRRLKQPGTWKLIFFNFKISSLPVSGLISFKRTPVVSWAWCPMVRNHKTKTHGEWSFPTLVH